MTDHRGSKWSIGSQNSILSIGSNGSILSVGSIGSILSALSAWSILAYRSSRVVYGRVVSGRLAGEPAQRSAARKARAITP
jgi:hypothetical protein